MPLPLLRLVLATGLALAASRAGAHPHIFIDTALRLQHDAEGRLASVEVSWTYDELFTLLLLEDMGLDQDMDTVLTADELAALQGFDMDWPPDYEGDLYLTAAGQPVALGPPQPGAAHLLPDGRLVGTHRRWLAQPVDAGAEPVAIRVYDPSFYTAYEIVASGTDSPDCRIEVFTPDLDAAGAQLQAALDALMATTGADEEVAFPAVGDKFAQEMRLTCGSR